MALSLSRRAAQYEALSSHRAASALWCARQRSNNSSSYTPGQRLTRLVVPQREVGLHDVAGPIPLGLRVPGGEQAQHAVGRVPPAGDSLHGRQAVFVPPFVEKRADDQINEEPFPD